MTIDEAIDHLSVLYERMDSKNCNCVDTTDISLTAVGIAIEALKAIDDFEEWRKEVYGE